MGWIIAGVWVIALVLVMMFFSGVKIVTEEAEVKECKEKCQKGPRFTMDSGPEDRILAPEVVFINDPPYTMLTTRPQQKKLGKMLKPLMRRMDQNCAVLGLKSTPESVGISGRSSSGTQASNRNSRTARRLKFNVGGKSKKQKPTSASIADQKTVQSMTATASARQRRRNK